MSRTKILQLFYSNLILLPIILCKVPSSNILYGIDRRNLDNEYCRLLFDASLDNCARLDIAARLSALLVYESIETDLAIIDLRIGQIFERNKFLAARNLNKSTIRAKFDELNTKIWKKKTGEKRFGMEDVCRLWSFGLEVTKLNEFLNKNQTIGEKEMNKLATLLKLNKNSECKQLAKVENVFEAKYGELALWVHTLRMLNGKGEIDQIVRTKQMMNRYLMEYKYIGMLELHNPLTMAFDIICDSILKTAFLNYYGLWMRQLHGQMFVQLLKVDENFAQKLKNEFETSLMKKYYLIELLEIESSKEVLNIKSKQIIQIKNYLMANGYFSESEMHKNERIVSELTRIVEEWCPNAIVQFPLSLLENEKLEPICILPEEIDRELIFGKLNFEMSEMAAKCEDKSLYCNLLMRSEFKSVRKIVKELTALPTLQFNFTDVPIEMAFILVPKVKLANFDVPIGLKTYEKLAKYFAENIEHFLNADHFDEGMHIDEVKLQNMIRKQLEKSKSFNGKFELDKVLGELKQLTNTKEAALKQRQIVAEQKVMLLALSRNFINEKIFEILSPDTKLEENICGMVKQNYNNKNERLRVALAYLELWAKNNFIHGRNMGYLDTPMLLIMMAKVFLMFPEAKWPMPVQLSQIDDKRIGEFLSWAPGREWFTKRQFLPKNLRKTIGQALAMPIISPLFPEQNEAAQINLSTAKVIQNELKYAFIKIRNLTDKSHDIIKSIAGNCKRFSEKYEHFVTFTCGGTKFNVEKFCDFVGKRLRHELLYFVENSLANWVRFCHVHPTRVPVEQSSNEQQQQQQQQQQQIGGSKLAKWIRF
uniref:polynucleotide adenylyltransferase n=1 Tax=Globodera pallida TaxID=36090 RepID=A0A183BQL4_GLOPA